MEEEYIPSQEVILKTIEYYKERLRGAEILKTYYRDKVQYLTIENIKAMEEIHDLRNQIVGKNIIINNYKARIEEGE
jgi:hypothetical protein